MKVTVIDYGLSNLLSVRHAFAHFGAETLLTSDPAGVLAAMVTGDRTHLSKELRTAYRAVSYTHPEPTRH